MFKRIYWRTCPACSRLWYATRKNARVTCNDDCYQQWQESIESDARNVYISPTTRQAVLDRDGWICQLCHEDIDKELEWPHEFSASMDHILPVSYGGPDGEWNLQAAHWICNVRRGNDLLTSQLGLPFAAV